MKITLKEAVINKKGEEVTELKLDLEKLTGNDLIQAEKEYRLLAPDGGVLAPEMYSKEYHALIAARATGVDVEVIKNLPAQKFAAISMAVQNFMLS